MFWLAFFSAASFFCSWNHFCCVYMSGSCAHSPVHTTPDKQGGSHAHLPVAFGALQRKLADIAAIERDVLGGIVVHMKEVRPVWWSDGSGG